MISSGAGRLTAWIFAAAAGAAVLVSMPASAGSGGDLATRIVGERAYIESNLINGFKVTEAGVERNMPGEARRAGVDVAAGFIVESSGGPYTHVLLTYLLFRDTRQADSYARTLHTDAGGNILTIGRKLEMGAPPGRQLHIKADLKIVCSIVDAQDLSLNCSVSEPKSAVLVSVLIGPGGPAPEAKAGESKVDYYVRGLKLALAKSAGTQDAIIVPALAALNRALGN